MVEQDVSGRTHEKPGVGKSTLEGGWVPWKFLNQACVEASSVAFDRFWAQIISVLNRTLSAFGFGCCVVGS